VIALILRSVEVLADDVAGDGGRQDADEPDAEEHYDHSHTPPSPSVELGSGWPVLGDGDEIRRCNDHHRGRQ
jgi:hypothetical protein